MIEKKLSELRIGETGKIINLDADVHIKRRLLELGLMDGQQVKILSTSPLKNCFLIELKSYSLCLRKNILNCVEVESDL